MLRRRRVRRAPSNRLQLRQGVAFRPEKRRPAFIFQSARDGYKGLAMKALLKGGAMGAGLALAATAAFGAGTDWQTSGHDLGSQRYSPLTQINKSNVNRLEIAWTYHLTPAGYSGRPRLAEAIPIVVGNQMYITSPYGEVLALNATTGALEWKYTLPDTDNPAERGAAYWKGSQGHPATIVL